MKIEVSIRLSIFTCRYTEAEAQCRMEEKKYVKVRKHACICGHFNYTSQFFLFLLLLLLFKLKLRCMQVI